MTAGSVSASLTLVSGAVDVTLDSPPKALSPPTSKLPMEEQKRFLEAVANTNDWSNVETIETPINTEHPSPVWLMSGDGRVFAYRALQDINGTEHGVVKVFGYDPSSQVFTSRGTIDPGGNPGFPMSSSNDGSIISVCGRGYDSSEGSNVGVCGVYKYNEDENNPNYEGQGLFYGEAQEDRIRADISGDGAVIAVSYEVGRKIKVFYWDAGEWKPKGNVITGVAAYGHRLSDDGSTLHCKHLICCTA